MAEHLTNIAFNIIESIIYLLICIFLNQMQGFIFKNKLKSLIFIIIYSTFLIFSGILLPPGIRPIFNVVFAVILLSFISQVSLYSAVISVAVTSIFLFTIEIVVIVIFMLLMNTSIENVTETYPVILYVGIITKGLELFIVILFSRSGIKFPILQKLRKPDTLFFLLALQILMVIIFIAGLGFIPSYNNNFVLYNIFLIVVFILVTILNVIDFRERQRLQAIGNKVKAQEEYIGNMENIINIIRREKHEFSNHINTILAMCVLNRHDAIEKINNYISKLSTNLKTSYHFFDTGNDYVDGILTVKSNFAFEHGMSLHADIKVPLKDMNINDYEITSIIANIVDNAFEAIIPSGFKEDKAIVLKTFEDNLAYYLSISNNGPAIASKDLDKIFTNGYSTKTAQKSDHGFGLYIVQQLVNRNNGVISVSSNEECTEFLIKFYKGARQYGKSS